MYFTAIPLAKVVSEYHYRAAIFAGTNTAKYPRQVIQGLCECIQILSSRVLNPINYSPFGGMAGLWNEPRTYTSLPFDRILNKDKSGPLQTGLRIHVDYVYVFFLE